MIAQSLNTRLLFAAGLVLAAFLSAAAFALDQAFRESASSSVRERLTGRIYMVLGTIDLEKPDASPELPDAALLTPESGHYAQIMDASDRRLWNSRSMLGLTMSSPGQPDVGQFQFSETVSSTGEFLFVLSYTVLWEGVGTTSKRYTIQVAEDETAYRNQIARFRQSLWLGFATIGIVLLLLQTAILRWGLKPLRDVALEVNKIEKGDQGLLSGEYPSELRALTKNLNALIQTNESHVKRYRNALGDLAHSLKTPLAVLRTSLETGRGAAVDDTTSIDALDQLDATINYQLHRAAAAGSAGIGGQVELKPIVEKIVNSLKKVYAARQLDIHVAIDDGLRFRGDSGDLMEIVGNIADNACKWARTKVQISAYAHVDNDAAERLIIVVRDDGLGMPETDIERALQRGARLDEATAGHGIGLAVVKELVEEVYRGTLEITSSPEGTSVSMSINVG